MEWKLWTLKIVKVFTFPISHLSFAPSPFLLHFLALVWVISMCHFQEESQYLRYMSYQNHHQIIVHRSCIEMWDGSDDMSNEILWKWNRIVHENFSGLELNICFNLFSQFIKKKKMLLSWVKRMCFSFFISMSFFRWLLPWRWFQFSRCICTHTYT